MFSIEQKIMILDKEFFIAKKSITAKIYEEFDDIKKTVEINLKQHYSFLSNEIITTGKINRGENLNGLPWINLDYPGFFKKENVFAIRFLFWWGTHFSITLHLSGEYLKQYRSIILKNMNNVTYADFFWCVNSIPWRYDNSEENYCFIKNLSQKQIQNAVEYNFIKISTSFSLGELKDFKSTGIEAAEKLLFLIKQH